MDGQNEAIRRQLAAMADAVGVMVTGEGDLVSPMLRMFEAALQTAPTEYLVGVRSLVNCELADREIE